jgi:arylformamidase
MIIDISRVLDEHTAPYPGDVPFAREFEMSIQRGDPCNVSSVRGSSHLGTHADLPSHFLAGAPDPNLLTFIGNAYVFDVQTWEDVLPKHISPNTRVLFKTANSRTPDNVFDEGFFCMTPAVVDWLVRVKAVLVGVDGPSVDPLGEHEFRNHIALTAAGIAILENLDLSNVSEGEYELIALPLKIPGADATWVRAVLRA